MSKEFLEKEDSKNREITNIDEAIKIYSEIVEAENSHGKMFYDGEIDEQVWVDTVYRVLNFPSYDVSWNEISMSEELIKAFWEWEFNQRRKLPIVKSGF